MALTVRSSSSVGLCANFGNVFGTVVVFGLMVGIGGQIVQSTEFEMVRRLLAMSMGLLALGVGSTLPVALSPWNSVVSTPALFLVIGTLWRSDWWLQVRGSCPRGAKKGFEGNKLNQIRRPSPKK